MKNKQTLRIVGIVIGIIIVAFVFLAIAPVAFVGAGQRGVIFNTFSGVQDRILGEGVHFRIPFVESVHTISIQVQKNDIKAEAASSDLQTVNTDIVVNWHLDGTKVNKVYQDIGDESAIVEKVLSPAVSEVVKASAAKYTAEEIISKRPLLKQDIDKALTVRVTGYHIILDDVSIVNVDFSKEFNAAIEAKTVAVQKAAQAQNDLVRIKTEAEQTVAKATAEAQAIKIKTEALAQNQNLVQLNAVERWNGVLPQYILGNTPLPFLNIQPK